VTLGIGVDLRHDAPDHLQAAAIDFLMSTHGSIVAAPLRVDVLEP
jgi:hypothetical protein